MSVVVSISKVLDNDARIKSYRQGKHHKYVIELKEGWFFKPERELNRVGYFNSIREYQEAVTVSTRINNDVRFKAREENRTRRIPKPIKLEEPLKLGMPLRTSALLAKLISTCYELNRDDFHIWFEFMGHVSGIVVKWTHGGYDERRGKDGNLLIYLDRGLGVDKEIESAIEAVSRASQDNDEIIETMWRNREARERKNLIHTQKKSTANINMTEDSGDTFGN